MNENQTKSQELQGVVDMYRDDLPSPQLFPAEFWRWRIKYAEEEELPGSRVPQPWSNAMRMNWFFQHIHFAQNTIHNILPVTSCECLKVKHLYAMHDEREQIIHYDMQIDLEEVVELFATMHPRMVELSLVAGTSRIVWTVSKSSRRVELYCHF